MKDSKLDLFKSSSVNLREHQPSLTLGIRCARIEILSLVVRFTDDGLNKSNKSETIGYLTKTFRTSSKSNR